MRSDFICEITVDTSGVWMPGVFAVEHTPTGRRYYVGTSNVGQRLRDNLKWLALGVHHNRTLQSDYTTSPHEFRFVLVERTGVRSLVRMLKQAWIERDRRGHPLGVFNVKNAVPTERTGSPPLAELALPREFLYEPPPVAPKGIVERIESVLDRPFAGSGQPLTPAERRKRAERLITQVKEMMINNWETSP